MYYSYAINLAEPPWVLAMTPTWK